MTTTTSPRSQSWIALAVGLWITSLASVASALPVTVTIDEIEINDVDHNQDTAATLYRYFVSSAFIGGIVPVDNVPNVGVCALAMPIDNQVGCQNRIRPPTGAWSFRRDVDVSQGTVDVLIQVRNLFGTGVNPLDLSPGPAAPAEWGLALTINLVDGSWRVRNDPNTVNPTETSSSFLGPGAIDSNRLTGHVRFSVTLCDGGPLCSDGTQLTCDGSACTTDASLGPICGGRPGTVSCNGGFACIAPPLMVPEEQNGVDDDCDGRVDECNADQLGQTFDCTLPFGACPSQPGVRTCTVAEAPPGQCVPFGASDPNVCQVECPAEVSVSNVPELREAIAQAPLTPCKDVIVLDPGFYDLTSPLQIDDSMEIRGIGSSFDCEGIDLDQKLNATATLDANLGSFHCDGDDGEDPGVTVIRNVMLPADTSEQSIYRVMEIGTPTSRPEVTLRHLTISGGVGQAAASPGSGIFALGPSRLKLFNVVVEDNVARGPGAGIVHGSESPGYPIAPTFVMVNSTVRRNRSTTPPLDGNIGLMGNGGGMRLSGVAFILRSTINDNAGIRGGGILMSGTLHLYNSTITRNLAGQGGAGLMMQGLEDAPGFLELRNNTITNNFAQWFPAQPMIRKDGAGIMAIGTVKVEAYGNIIADNVECRDIALHGQNGANCLADEGASIQSLGSNVGSADCRFQSIVTLPGSGPVASDTVLALGWARDLDDPAFSRFPDPYRAAVDSICQIGAALPPMPDAPDVSVAQVEAFAALPSSDREVFDFNQGVHLHLVGGLADQGGPTQTLAPGADSPALGAAASYEDPGVTGDPFPSAQPLCPSADQRGFVVANGGVPAICDAGSFQSTATADQSADSAEQALRSLFPDTDGDGIADDIDDSPLAASFFFSDLASGGITTGSIQTAGDQVLALFDAFPNPAEGILALALSSGGSAPAILTACGGSVEVALYPGDQQLVTCCPAGTNIIIGTEQNDVLDGTNGDDCIHGLGGDDQINAFDGDDFVSGGGGRDVIATHQGDDYVIGGDGDDVIDAGTGNDVVHGLGGVDTCSGGSGVNTISCEIAAHCTAACCASGTCGAAPPPSESACGPAYMQSSCLSYSLGSVVSFQGRNWECTNGNCANCAGFPSCAPGASGCPWGVVWTDRGLCE